MIARPLKRLEKEKENLTHYRVSVMVLLGYYNGTFGIHNGESIIGVIITSMK